MRERIRRGEVMRGRWKAETMRVTSKEKKKKKMYIIPTFIAKLWGFDRGRHGRADRYRPRICNGP